MQDIFKPLLAECSKLLLVKPSFVVAIDGRAASGKSTLAAMLASELGASVVHADDFFLPFDMRSEARLSEPGGNIHYERFATEVCERLGTSFDYGVFDCSCGALSGKRHVDGASPVIIEGAYSLSPRFGRYYDISVFLTSRLECRLSRIASRAPEKLEMFKSRWIPLEEAYFSAYGIEHAAELIIDTTDL